MELWHTLALSAAVLTAACAAGLLLHWLLFDIAGRIAKRSGGQSALLIHYVRRPLRLLVPLLVLQFVMPAASLPGSAAVLAHHALSLCGIAAVAWLLLSLAAFCEAFLCSRYTIAVSDNLAARKVQTQIGVLKRVLGVIIWVIAASTMLMTFETVRQVGTSILASAGVAGIIIGFAAQRSIATMFAGLQIAVTQPIRIDDVVIVENEWGRIEDITLTYVVVRIWDQRRLVLPITYFTEKPFQNWTRVSADILGTVFLYVDYTVPVQAIRDKLQELLDASPLWDRRVGGVQVTGATEHTVEVRALMSATDASKAWDLRCEVREKLIDFIQQHYPEALPRTRAQLHPERPPAGDARPA
jgi:small-conductance mechanosensitive channel